MRHRVSQKVAVMLAAHKEISVNVAGAAVLLKLDDVLAVNTEVGSEVLKSGHRKIP